MELAEVVAVGAALLLVALMGLTAAGARSRGSRPWVAALLGAIFPATWVLW